MDYNELQMKLDSLLYGYIELDLGCEESARLSQKLIEVIKQEVGKDEIYRTRTDTGI